jgi:hypothetical protein
MAVSFIGGGIQSKMVATENICFSIYIINNKKIKKIQLPAVCTNKRNKTFILHELINTNFVLFISFIYIYITLYHPSTASA